MAKRDYARTMSALMKSYPEAAASERATPWECLLFTALTARSRDDQVEGPFRALMKRYPTPKSLASAKLADVEKVLRSIGLYKDKSKNAIGMAEALVSEFGGVVPHTMDELVSLPGVGRKTASCVLVYSFGVPAIAVDTHVHRIVNRLGWVRTKTPPQTEMALRETLPEKHWLDINRVMVSFGRGVCIPGKPKCFACPVAKYCEFEPKTEK